MRHTSNLCVSSVYLWRIPWTSHVTRFRWRTLPDTEGISKNAVVWTKSGLIIVAGTGIPHAQVAAFSRPFNAPVEGASTTTVEDDVIDGNWHRLAPMRKIVFPFYLCEFSGRVLAVGFDLTFQLQPVESFSAPPVYSLGREVGQWTTIYRSALTEDIQSFAAYHDCVFLVGKKVICGEPNIDKVYKCLLALQWRAHNHFFSNLRLYLWL